MESIFESLENLPVSEGCFEEIMDLVEAILDEGRLVDDNGRRTDAYFDLRDKMTSKLKDQKAMASALRKQELKKDKEGKREEKEIEKTELPKVEHDYVISDGNLQNAKARYSHELEKNGKHNPVTKRALESVKHFKKQNDKAREAVNGVRDKMSDKRLKALFGRTNADAYKNQARELSDKITHINR